jgi:glyoxylase-like metal-dependent hydrolase (beta-lactamase superfamily II)
MLLPVSKSVSLIQTENGGKYPHCNCLLIDDEIKAVIDTGFEPGDLKVLQAMHLDVVINSHFHEDHVMNNRYFPDAEVWAHEDDAPAIRSLEAFQDFFGFKIFNKEHWGKKFIKVANLVPCPVHKEFKADEVLDFGRVKLRVIHTPGHTPGHCSFYQEQTGVLFTADIDLTRFGPWYAHTCSNLTDFIASIKKCMDINPPVILSGHKGIIKENIKERLQAYMDVILTREARVINHLKESPLTLDQLSYKNIFYDDAQTGSDPFMRLLEKMAVYVHLQRLMELGEVKQQEDVFYIV